MKKLPLFIFILLLGFTTAPAAQGSSVILKPSTIAVKVGSVFTLPVMIDGEGVEQYTVKLVTHFPADLLEITSFAFRENWFALSQTGYDSLDNKLGELIKTGGYPKGFSGKVPFGTITFRVKRAGEGSIIVGPQSFVLDKENKNTLSSQPQVYTTVTATTASAPKATYPTPPIYKPPVAEVTPEITREPLPVPPSAEQNIFDVSQTPVQNEGPSPVPFFIFSLAAVVLLLIIGGSIFMSRRRASAQKKINDKDLTN